MNKIIWWLSWNQADGEKNSIHLIRKCACSKKRTNTHTQAIKKEENSREDHNKGRNSLTYHWLRMSPVPQRTTVGSKYQTSTIYPFLFISYNYVQTDCTVKHTQFPSNSMNSSHLHLKTSLDIVTHISRLSGCQPTCAVYICLWSASRISSNSENAAPVVLKSGPLTPWGVTRELERTSSHSSQVERRPRAWIIILKSLFLQTSKLKSCPILKPVQASSIPKTLAQGKKCNQDKIPLKTKCICWAYE